MLAALARDNGDKIITVTSRTAGRQPAKRIAVDFLTGTITHQYATQGYVKLAPGELEDSIADLFNDLPILHPEFLDRSIKHKAYNDDGSVFLGEAVLARAAEIEAERKARMKEEAKEARRLRKLAKAISKDSANDNGAKQKAPRKVKILTGRDIPSQIRGRVTVTGSIQAKTGPALIIDVAFRNTIHSGIVVWSGAYQQLIANVANTNTAIDLTIAQPDNPRFRPFVRCAA